MQPTPVEVVRGPKGPGFWRRVVEAILTAIITSILTAFFLALWAPKHCHVCFAVSTVLR